MGLDRPLVFCVTFLSAFALITPAFSSIILAKGREATDYDQTYQVELENQGFDPNILSQYDFYENDDGTGYYSYAVNPGDAGFWETLDFHRFTGTTYVFHKPTGMEGDSKVKAGVGDEGENEWYLWRTKEEYWGLTHTTMIDEVSFDTLADEYDVTSGQVFHGMTIGGVYQLVLKPDNALEIENKEAFRELLGTYDNYRVYVARSLMDQAGTSTSSWNVISMLLFFDAPDISPTVNAFIAIPIWTMIVYLAYRLILLAIPFVGG